MVLTIPDRRPSARAWRTFAVPFIWIGLSQLYNAVNGLCRKVFQRGGAQLRVWELQDASYRMLEPTQSRPEAVPPTPPPKDKLTESREVSERFLPTAHPVSLKESGASKWDDASSSDDEQYAELPDASDSPQQYSPMPLLPRKSSAPPVRRFSWVPQLAAKDRNGFRRPPIFGPEKIVQDKRIRAVHARIIRHLLVFVVCGTLVSDSLGSVS